MSDYGFDKYQEDVSPTAKYPKVKIIIDDGEPIDVPWFYPLLGLLGETGELAEKFKKLVRDKNGVFDDIEHVGLFQKEVGDVLWYTNRLALALGSTLRDVARQNVDKLLSRLSRGKIGGSGDTR